MVDAVTGTPLSGDDARILDLESGPIRGHTLKVLVLEGGPEEVSVDSLRTEVQERLVAVPRWRQRLAPAPEAPHGLAWEDDPDFDLDRHVRLLAPDGPVDASELRRMVARIMVDRLDRRCPPWTLHVVPGLADGRCALVWKVHHCLADGTSIMRAGSRLLWREQPGPPPTRAPSRARAGAPAQLTAGARLTALAGHRGLLLREFRRVRQLSPLAGDVGQHRAVAFAHCTLDELRAIGSAGDPRATVNDVLLAVVAGALRRWLHDRQLPDASMKVQVPVSMHPEAGQDAAGNRDSFLFLTLPLAEDDPVARLRAVAEATRLRKNRHDAGAIYALRESLAHAPAVVRRGLQHVVQGPHEYSLNVSNVPGPAGPIEVLGRRVTSLHSIAEVAPHHALRVAAVSLAGTLYIGLCADPDLVPRLDDLATGIRASVDELAERLVTT
jgi:diacylglycerol O-acyltransferase